MRADWPQIIKDVGFDFSWDEKKVWALDVPVSQIDIGELLWHFNIPFLSEGDGIYNLTPREVLVQPGLHNKEYKRMLVVDLRYAIDIMENKGRWTILDGLHRLMKMVFYGIYGVGQVDVRRIPREKIPEIVKE